MRQKTYLCGVFLVVFMCSTGLASEAVDAQDLIAKIRAVDGLYLSSINVTGTRVDTLTGKRAIPPTQKEWHFSTDGKRTAIQEHVTHVLEWSDVLKEGEPGPPEDAGKWSMATRSITYYDSTGHARLEYVAPMQKAGPLARASSEGVEPATSGRVDIHSPDNKVYERLRNDVIWSMGRGFSSEIQDIHTAAALPDGSIALVADGRSVAGGKITWELVVDPRAAYMVRNAKMFIPGMTDPYLEMTNSGTKWTGDCCFPEESSTVDRALDVPLRRTRHFDTAALNADGQFLDSMHAGISGKFPVPMDITDHRSTPPMTVTYVPPKARQREAAKEGLVVALIDETKQSTEAAYSVRAEDAPSPAIVSKGANQAPQKWQARTLLLVGAVVALALISVAAYVLARRMRR